MKEVRMPWRRGGVCGLALAATGVLGLTGTAPAHEWYPYKCCSGHDCRPVPQDAVEYTPAGWRIKANGETIPFNKVQFSPDGQFHVCTYGGVPTAKTICLFTPGFGS